MDELKAIEDLARRARSEQCPVTDVNVRRLLRTFQPEQGWLMPMAISAGISALAACIVLMVALHSSSSTATTTSGDSVSSLFDPVKVELP